MSDRSKEMSEYIVNNMQDENVINNAVEKFNMNSEEIGAMRVIHASLAVVNAMMSVFNSYGEVAKEGLQMIKEVEIERNIRNTPRSTSI